MSQVPDIYLSPRTLLDTIIITGTIMFSIAGFQGATSQSSALETFSQKGTSNFRTMGSTKSRLISKSGSAYLMEDGDTEKTNRERSYLHQLGSIINIIAEHPLPGIVDNDPHMGSNLTKISIYEILLNGSIINTRQCFMGPFTTDAAYATSGFTVLDSPYSPTVQTLDEIEVMAMTQELKQLADDLRELNKKLDGKMDSFDTKFDTKLIRLEAKIDKSFETLMEISNRLAEKVNTINTNVVTIKTTMDINNSWKEKLQIPIVVGLIVAIANNLPAIFKAFAVTPKP